MSTTKQKIEGSLQMRAAFNPATIDTTERTVDVTFATEREVVMYNWSIGRFKEILVCNSSAGDLTRLNNGAPLCDAHNTYSARTILGSVVPGSAKFVNNQGVATVRFSKNADVEPVWQNVIDGHLTGISVAYIPTEYQEIDNIENTIPTLRATKWEATEISLAPVQADRDSMVRSGKDNTPHEITIIRSKSNINTMEENQSGASAPEKTSGAAPAAVPEVVINEAEVRNAATTAERSRVKEIGHACRAAKMPTEFQQKLVDDGTTLEAARKLIIDSLAAGETAEPGANARTIVAGKDEAEKRAGAVADALILRAGVAVKGITPERTSAAREFRSLSLLEIAKDCLVRSGVDIRGLDKMDVAARAITSSTSDFPVILGGIVHQILLNDYQAVADTWRNFCMIGSVSDFRDHKRLRLGSFSRLDKVKEDGQFKNKAISDATSEKIAADTYGNIINISRKMIINDDLQAFTRLASQLGRAAARSIEIDVYALLAANPTMDDGITLFHATHNNLIASGAAVSVAQFDAMRVKMASQQDPGSNDYLDLRPSVLLVGIAQGGSAKVINDALYDPDTANKIQKPNMVKGLFNQVVDTARISGTEYYAFANPSEEPVIEVAFLDGNQTPFMEQRMGFEVDGLEWKIRHDYGVGAIGFRGAVKNAGA